MPRRRALREPRLRSHPGRKALAFHEAGHAVIGYLLGLEIEHVTIVPTPHSLGHCRYRGWEDGMAPADLDLHLARGRVRHFELARPSLQSHQYESGSPSGSLAVAVKVMLPPAEIVVALAFRLTVGAWLPELP